MCNLCSVIGELLSRKVAPSQEKATPSSIATGTIPSSYYDKWTLRSSTALAEAMASIPRPDWPDVPRLLNKALHDAKERAPEACRSWLESLQAASLSGSLSTMFSGASDTQLQQLSMLLKVARRNAASVAASMQSLSKIEICANTVGACVVCALVLQFRIRIGATAML